MVVGQGIKILLILLSLMILLVGLSVYQLIDKFINSSIMKTL